MQRVVGVDGYRSGWIAVELHVEHTHLLTVTARHASHVSHLLYDYADAAAIAVDMPIGLWDDGRARARPCDTIARNILGLRASTIFSPPTRAMLSASSYESLRGAGLSIQAFHLIPSIRQLDELLTPAMQERIWESHPELSFTAITGTPICASKHTRKGSMQRIAALSHAFGLSPAAMETLVDDLRRMLHMPTAATRDIIDAFALAWSAWRSVRGCAEVCIGEPATDSRGLFMAIRY